MVRELLLIFDSARYDMFKEVYQGEGELYKAYSHGTWTKPSISSMLCGYLPISDYGQPYNPSWVMGSDYIFKGATEAWFLTANAWTFNMEPAKYHEKQYKEFSTPKMVDDCEKIMLECPSFFVAILFTETHGPYMIQKEESIEKEIKKYNNGEDNNAPELAWKKQKRALEYLLYMTEPLTSYADRTFITSDHGELMGEHHLIGHDPSFPFHPKLLEVPLAVIS